MATSTVGARMGEGLGRALAVTALLLVGCTGDPGTPLPPLVADVERVAPEVHLGMSARELRSVRGTYTDSLGVEQEMLDATTFVGYGFLPWAEGERAASRATLEGVEIRDALADSLRLIAAWEDAVERGRELLAAVPECAEMRTFRYRARQAAFFDSVRVTVVAEVHTHGDGQGYDAILTTRYETEAMRQARFDAGRGPVWGEAVPCPGG